MKPRPPGPHSPVQGSRGGWKEPVDKGKGTLEPDNASGYVQVFNYLQLWFFSQCLENNGR